MVIRVLMGVLGVVITPFTTVLPYLSKIKVVPPSVGGSKIQVLRISSTNQILNPHPFSAMPYYNAQGQAIDAATYGQQFAGAGDLGSFNLAYGQAQKNNQLGSAYAAADATASREASDYTASANAETANRTNSLAQQLASARNNPGGGIRRGNGRGKGLTAGNATPGLTAANAASKLATRKTELRSQVDEEFANKPQNPASYNIGTGNAITLW